VEFEECACERKKGELERVCVLVRRERRGGDCVSLRLGVTVNGAFARCHAKYLVPL